MGKNELIAITPGTQAESHPQLKVGQILQSVAGRSVSDMSHEEVISLITGSNRPLDMSFDAKKDVCVWTPRVQFICEPDIIENSTLIPLISDDWCNPYNDRCSGSSVGHLDRAVDDPGLLGSRCINVISDVGFQCS